MGSSYDPDAYGRAMSAACSYVRRYPKLTHWIAQGDAEAEQILNRLKDRRAVKRWLSQKAYTRECEMLSDLVDAADDFVNCKGQAARLMETYRQQRDKGHLDKLNPTARAVHRAVFSLGIYNGAPVLASLRYLLAVMRSQSEVDVSPAAVSKHIRALVDRGLFLSYDPGYRGVHGEAGRIALELSPAAREPDIDLVLQLSLPSRTLLALSDYVVASQERKAKANAERRAYEDAMARILLDPTEIMRGIDLEHDWTELHRPTGDSVFVPARIGDHVMTEHGTFLGVELVVHLTHQGSCESSYLPPLACPCVSAEVEEIEQPVRWGNSPPRRPWLGVTNSLSAVEAKPGY